MKLEDIGLIGNCQFAALVHASGDVVWTCWPRFDSEPVFGKLLDPDGGRFGIGAADGAIGRQQYLDNTTCSRPRSICPMDAFASSTLLRASSGTAACIARPS
jgi:hypothetical protein